MRLQTILSSSPHVLSFLLAHNIRTPSDFLYGEPVESLIRRAQPSVSADAQEADIQTASPPVTYADLACARDLVLAALAPPGLTADVLLQQELTRYEKLRLTHWSTKNSELDTFLDAMKAGVVEISGERGVGKSALALHIAISSLINEDYALVHWIDTRGEFLPERAVRVVRDVFGGGDVLRILDRLRLSIAFDFTAIRETMSEIQLDLPSLEEISNATPLLRLIIVDALTPIISPLLSPESAEGHATMVSFMQELYRLAVEYSLVILVINDSTSTNPNVKPKPTTTTPHPRSYNSYNSYNTTNSNLPQLSTAPTPTGTRKPALGPSFTFMCDATLWMTSSIDTAKESDIGGKGKERERADGDGEVLVEVVKSRSSPSRVRWSLRVVDGVIIPIL